MLWIIKEDRSYQIVSCNLFYNRKNKMHEIWASNAKGENFKLDEKRKREDVLLIKEAIDYAIETGETALRL